MHSRLLLVLLGTLVLTLESGCPWEWGKAGTNDRAVHKDVRLLTRENCAAGKHWETCAKVTAAGCVEGCVNDSW